MSHVKVGLLCGEFFVSTLRTHNGFGGYGMLARHYLAEYLPDAQIEMVTILGFNDRPAFEFPVVDGRKQLSLVRGREAWPRWQGMGRILKGIDRRLPRRGIRAYLNSFDVFLSVETMTYTPEMLRYVPDKKLIIYLQDPRPQGDWEELDTVIGTDDGSPRPDAEVCKFYEQLIREDRLMAISQGADLVEKAKDLYRWPKDFPVRLVRNPVLADEGFDLDGQVKENAVLFLGRLDPVKRPWLALETARRMPHVQFYFLGSIHNPMMPYIIQPYCGLPNVHLLGHREGDMKRQLLATCKVLINTSIHEAIPVSFLEALAYGTLIVSCQNPDAITERYGVATGRVLGDGREQADVFVKAIQRILDDEPGRRRMAHAAREYVREQHNLQQWVATMRSVICAGAGKARVEGAAVCAVAAEASEKGVVPAGSMVASGQAS